MMRKTIVIVGASRGIGKELVKILSQDERNLIVALARNTISLDEFKETANVQVHSFDLNTDSVRISAEKIFKNISSIDILINNAGKLVNKPFLELSKEDLEESYQVNVIGVMETVQAAVPKMIETGGHIVNISSMGGFQGTVKFAGLAAYSTSKAAVASFTELLAEEYKDTKIKVNCLCLGSAQTEMLEEAFPGFQAPVSAKQMAVYIADFSLSAHHWMHGRIIPVSLTTP
jgi:3-oxoacyl-[acyl-carrier protein] reductase